MKEGYIKLPRSIIDDEYFSQKFTRAQALIDLYFLAGYKDKVIFIRGNRVAVKRGQIAASVRELSDRWHWSKNTVHQFLEWLEEEGKIDINRSHIINIITIPFL